MKKNNFCFSKIKQLTTICISGLSLFLFHGFAYGGEKGIDVIVKNYCEHAITFSIKNSEQSQDSQLNPNRQSLPIHLNQDTKTDVTFISQKNRGSIRVINEVKTLYNQFTVESIAGNIGTDTKHKEWHSWFGTPSLTVTACPEKIDIENSPVFYGITRLLVFGDSLSDTGLMHELTLGRLPRTPPYYNGSFSNGEVWSVMLANQLEGKVSISNYAFAGSPASFHAGAYLPYTFSAQVDTFEINSRNWQDKNHYMAIIFFGANDYLSHEVIKISMDKKTDKVINNIHDNTLRLMKHGTRKFIFIGLPDLSLIPEAKTLYKNPETGKQFTRMHNSKLQQLAKTMARENKGYEFHFVSLYDIFNEITFQTAQFNKKYNLQITEVENMCWKSGYFTAVSKKDRPCSNPGNYLFWDHAHPTTQVHHAILEYIKSILKIKTIH